MPTESEQRFQVLLESAPDAIVIADESGTIQIVNGQAEALFGYSRDEMVGEPVEILVPEAVRERHRLHRSAYVSAPRSRPMGVGMELTARHRDGREMPVEISLGPSETGDGLLVTAVVRDASERKRLAEVERKAAETELQLRSEKIEDDLRSAVLRRVITAQEEERRRVARSLHDETAQRLTGLSLGLGRIEAADDLETVRTEAAALGREVVEAMRELRRVAGRLRPAALDDLGLIPALEQLAAGSSVEGGAEISIRHSGFERRVDPALETTVYRVIQEALTNTAKHADAATVEIAILREGDVLSANVRDDGVGFDPGATSGGGLGLGGMRERAGLAGGELEITSAPGEGTEVVLTVRVG